MITKNNVTPENADYTYKIDSGFKNGHTVYIMDEKVQKIIDKIAIPLDLKVSFSDTGMHYCYNMILSWDHW
jgi:hypothetical protein